MRQETIIGTSIIVSFKYQKGGHYMPSRKIALQVRLDETLHAKAKVIANTEIRSLNSQIEYFIVMGIKKYEEEHGSIPINNDNHK